MTEERIEIEDEPTQDLVREAEGKDDTGVEPAGQVIEGEIVEETEHAPEEASAVSEEPEEEIDELTALRQQLEAAQAKADEYLDDLRRERAAFQNYKKRQENERAELRQMALSSLLLQILPIVDDFERALETMPEDQSGQPWVEGVTLIRRKLQTTMEVAGVVPAEVEPGQLFDPFVHQAVSYEDHEERQGGEIIAVVQKGYALGGRTLRPAMVRVAK